MRVSSGHADPVRIVDVVFGLPNARPLPRSLLALIAAVGLHAGAWLWAGFGGPSLESWSARVAARVHAELGREQIIDAPKPDPPPPVKEPEPPAPAPARIAKASEAAPRQQAAVPPPPAQAGSIVAHEPDPGAPVDLSNSFVTGAAQTYAGGATSTSGTNTKAVTRRDAAVAPPATPAPAPRAARSTTPDKSSPVTVLDPSWTCPWPHDADSESIDAEVAVVRVTVRPDSSVETANIVSDPGHGFGRAAVTCALRAHFASARDSDGHPIRSQSGPIRVRFTR